jgi:nucleoside-diphosphate-sugar epimerase
MVYGERDHQHREESILRRVRAGRDRIPAGSATFLWTRGYVRDIATGIRLALESDAFVAEILNLGETRTWSMGLWARHVLEAAGADAQLTRVPDVLLPDDLKLLGTIAQHLLVGRAPAWTGQQHLLVDSSKARDLLGWEQTDPHEALRRSVAWHLANPPEDASDDFTADDRALDPANWSQVL